MARRPRHPILRNAAQTTAYYPLKRGGAYPQFFGKSQIIKKILSINNEFILSYWRLLLSPDCTSPI